MKAATLTPALRRPRRRPFAPMLLFSNQPCKEPIQTPTGRPTSWLTMTVPFSVQIFSSPYEMLKHKHALKGEILTERLHAACTFTMFLTRLRRDYHSKVKAAVLSKKQVLKQFLNHKFMSYFKNFNPCQAYSDDENSMSCPSIRYIQLIMLSSTRHRGKIFLKRGLQGSGFCENARGVNST